MADSLGRYETLVDKQIRLAQERGDFDDLPGAGKPLPGLADSDDELWWLKGYLRREGLSGEAMLPPALQLRAEIERLPDTVRTLPSEQVVRDAVGRLNERIAEWLRAPSGPWMPVGPVDPERIVAGWVEHRRLATEQQSAEQANDPSSVAATARPRWWRRFGRRQPAA